MRDLAHDIQNHDLSQIERDIYSYLIQSTEPQTSMDIARAIGHSWPLVSIAVRPSAPLRTYGLIRVQTGGYVGVK